MPPFDLDVADRDYRLDFDELELEPEPEVVELPEHLGSTSRRLPHGVIRREGRATQPPTALAAAAARLASGARSDATTPAALHDDAVAAARAEPSETRRT
jgi:hypothetical protein